MIDSKPWIWNKVNDPYWESPAEEVIFVVSHWKDKGFDVVLDLGCGTGRHSIFLAEQGFVVSAFDLAQDGTDTLIQKIKERGLSINVEVGDMVDLSYDNEAFDCLLSMYSIHHTDMNGLKVILEHIRRVLKRDGEAFITLTSKESDAWSKHTDSRVDNNTLIKTEGPEVDVPHTYLDYEDVMSLLQDFQVLKIKQIITYLPTQNKKHAHFYILMKKK